MQFKDVEVGTKIVRALIGGGFTTEGIITVEAVNDEGIFIEGCDEDFSKDSVYGYHFDGRPFANWTPGFSSKLLRIATQADIDELEDY